MKRERHFLLFTLLLLPLSAFADSVDRGAYCLFTDASLVGKPPEKNDFKVFTVGIIWFNDAVGVSVVQVCDDEKGPDFATMLAMTNSATLTNN